MNNTELMEDWEVVENLPKYNGGHIFNIEIYNQIRIVRRINGVLLFLDCCHPMQNVFCDESKITAWKIQ